MQLPSPRQPNIYAEVMTGSVGDSLASGLEDLRADCGIASAVAYVMLPSWADVALETRRRWDGR